MPERAKVTSIEDLDGFRTNLVVYLEKACRTLDEVSDEVMRTRLWLENDRRVHWESQVRHRAKALEQAEHELFGARLSRLREVTQAEQLAVLRARRALEEAEEKLSRVKHWTRHYDSQVQPLAREVDKLRNVLVHDMRRGLGFLAGALKSLEAYADLAPPEPASSTQPSPAPPATDASSGPAAVTGGGPSSEGPRA